MVLFTRIDPTKNMWRFWLARVSKTLLGEWTLGREWGRIGQPGTVWLTSFGNETEARRAEERGIRQRTRNGYEPTLNLVSRWAEVMAAGGSIRAPERAAKNHTDNDRDSPEQRKKSVNSA